VEVNQPSSSKELQEFQGGQQGQQRSSSSASVLLPLREIHFFIDAGVQGIGC